MTLPPILRVLNWKQASSSSCLMPSSSATLKRYSLLTMMAISSLFLLSSFLKVRLPRLSTDAMMVKMQWVYSGLK